jgi:hypothetical protein
MLYMQENALVYVVNPGIDYKMQRGREESETV